MEDNIELANILLVEDCELDVALTKVFIEKRENMQFNLHVVGNGEEAIKFLTDKNNPKIDLILLDINMPGMNGFEFLNYMKHHNIPEEPVIICSTSFVDEDILKAMSLGAFAYMHKPASWDKLRIPVHELETLRVEHGDEGSRIVRVH